VVIYGTEVQREKHRDSTFILGVKKLQIVREYKYLGMEMGRERARWRTVLKRNIVTAEQTMRRAIVSGYRQGHMNGEQCVKIWKG